jgi:pilus assembly protein Flp/PilA
MSTFSRFLKNESGATAIEYGLIAALVAVAIIGALGTLAGGLENIFNGVGTRLNTANSNAG